MEAEKKSFLFYFFFFFYQWLFFVSARMCLFLFISIPGGGAKCGRVVANPFTPAADPIGYTVGTKKISFSQSHSFSYLLESSLFFSIYFFISKMVWMYIDKYRNSKVVVGLYLVLDDIRAQRTKDLSERVSLSTCVDVDVPSDWGNCGAPYRSPSS